MVKMIIFIVAYIVLAPFIGGFLAGLDRIISARMQGRVGPPVLQPFYDVLKLFEKEKITVNKVQDFYVHASCCLWLSQGVFSLREEICCLYCSH